MNIVTLMNGLRVGNFSSPHDFMFDDGTVLPAVSPETAERLKVSFIENITTYPIWRNKKCVFEVKNVELRFELTDEIREEMTKWIKLYSSMSQDGKVDIVLVPLPMMTAMKQEMYARAPFRCIRIEDRNNKVVSSSKFCT